MANWLKTKNIEFVWNGAWSDPELKFNGSHIDYWSIEDFCCSEMRVEGLDFNDDDVFADWVRKNEDIICSTIVEFSDANKEFINN